MTNYLKRFNALQRYAFLLSEGCVIKTPSDVANHLDEIEAGELINEMNDEILALRRQVEQKDADPVLFEIGKGKVVVTNGHYGEQPAVFIRPAIETGGVPDTPLYGEDLERQDNRIFPDERVLLFQTHDHAEFVAGSLLRGRKQLWPEEPTEDMLEACLFNDEQRRHKGNAYAYLRRVYKAMREQVIDRVVARPT